MCYFIDRLFSLLFKNHVNIQNRKQSRWSVGSVLNESRHEDKREKLDQKIYQVWRCWEMSEWRARLGYRFYIQPLTTSANIYWTLCEYKWFWIYSAWVYRHTHTQSDFCGHKLNLWIVCEWCYIRTSTYKMEPVKLEGLLLKIRHLDHRATQPDFLFLWHCLGCVC